MRVNNSIKYVSSIIAFFALFLNPAGTQERKIILGGKAGWPELSVQDGIVSGTGRFGYESRQLDTNGRRLGLDTDMLLDFEGSSVTDRAENYSVDSDSSVISQNAAMGKSGRLFRGTGGIRLRGNSSSVFGKSGTTGPFTIEFWLNPFIAENGEIVFSWRSSRTVAGYPLYQFISASFFNNTLVWTFSNVFDGYTKNDGAVTLSGYKAVVPEKWSHHSISYNDENGCLEYWVDGSLESLVYVTSNGREAGGSVHSMILGVVADIEICPEFTGLADDFNLVRSAVSEDDGSLLCDIYGTEGGRLETMPIMVSKGAALKRVDAVTTVPEQTDILFYVRSGDNFFNWTRSEPEWIAVNPGEEIADVKGLYFQVAAELLPDGAGTKTPSLTQLELTFDEVPSPLAPFTVIATPGDGEVTLNWSYSVDNTAGGYYVYYGERPGEYLGRTAAEGRSPIRAGNSSSFTVSGLRNGKIYYFAVASYSKIDDRITGELSKEVFARPQKKTEKSVRQR